MNRFRNPAEGESTPSEEYKWPDTGTRPKFDTRLVKKLIGKKVIIGYTYLKPDGTIDRQEQKHGVVTRANAKEGVAVLEHGTARTIWLPPDLRSWKPAKKGLYTLRSTGEDVGNPDYTTNWTVTVHDGATTIDPAAQSTSRTFNWFGIGTDLYGRAGKREDGSYVATKWIVLFMLPIYPLASFRVHKHKANVTFGYGTHMKHFATSVRLNVRQVVKTYAFTYTIVILTIILLASIAQKSP